MKKVLILLCVLVVAITGCKPGDEIVWGGNLWKVVGYPTTGSGSVAKISWVGEVNFRPAPSGIDATLAYYSVTLKQGKTWTGTSLSMAFKEAVMFFRGANLPNDWTLSERWDVWFGKIVQISGPRTTFFQGELIGIATMGVPYLKNENFDGWMPDTRALFENPPVFQGGLSVGTLMANFNNSFATSINWVAKENGRVLSVEGLRGILSSPCVEESPPLPATGAGVIGIYNAGVQYVGPAPANAAPPIFQLLSQERVGRDIFFKVSLDKKVYSGWVPAETLNQPEQKKQKTTWGYLKKE